MSEPTTVRMGALAAYLSLALALSAQGGAAIWWAGTQNTRLTSLEARVAELLSTSPLYHRQIVEAALAVESAAGVWEIVQAGGAELIAPGRYRLTRLLRGQRGTEYAMGNPAPAGARVVVLDTTLALLPIAEADLGLPWNWRVGPPAPAPG